MGYKEKTCPKCNSVHNKRGEFCSRSCGNSRPLTKEQKQKIGAAKSAWLTGGSEEAEVAVHNFVSGGNNKTAEPIAPLVPRDIGHGRYVEDGDIWEEVQLPESLPPVNTLCGAMWEGYVAHVCESVCMCSRVDVYALSSVYGCNIAILI